MQVGSLLFDIVANVARLQQDMQKAQKTVGDAVNKMNNILGTIGVGVSVAGFASMVKGVIDMGDRLNDLSKQTGATVVELGGLGKAAKLNGSDLDSVARALGVMNKNMVAGSSAFHTIGVATKQANGDFRQSIQVFLDVADKFSQMQDGAAKATVAQQLFGKGGRELIPLLNQNRQELEKVIDEYARYSGMSQEAAEKSDLFNDNLALLQGRIEALKTGFVGDLLPTLINISQAMVNTGESTDKFSFAAQVVAPILKGLAIAGFTVIDTFRGMGREIGARAAQLEALSRLDFQGARFIGAELAKENAQSRIEFDRFINTVLHGDQVLKQHGETQKTLVNLQIKTQEELADEEKLRKNAARAAEQQDQKYTQLIASIRETIQANQLQLTLSRELTTAEKQKLEIDRQVASGQLVLNSAKRQKIALILQELEVSERLLKNQQFSKKAAEDLATASFEEIRAIKAKIAALREENALIGLNDEQRFNRIGSAQLEEAAALRAAAAHAGPLKAAYLGRANDLEKLSTLQKDLFKEQQVTEYSRNWNQAWSNMESTGRNAFIQFASHGTSAMKSIGEAIKVSIFEMLYQLTIRKWMINIGTSIEGALLGNGSGATGTASNLMSLANLAKGGKDFIKSGFGVGSALAGVGGMLPGSAGAFFSGMGGGTVVGVSSPAALAGASVAGFAAPVAAYLGSVMLGSKIAGDKDLFGMDGTTTSLIGAALGGPMGAIIAGSLNALFGHGPYKFRQQSLQGTASSAGFDGDMTDVYRSKGGLLVSNRHKSFSSALPEDVARLLDETVSGFYKSAHGFAENLGLDVHLVDGFTQELQIKSEKNQRITDEAVAEMLNGIGDSVANNLLPNLSNLKQGAETAFQTLQRLSSEFSTLENAATLLGHSVAGARDFLLNNTTFAGRTDFIARAGGEDALTQSAAFFAQNFLTDAERLAPMNERLINSLNELGLSGDLTTDQFKNLVQSFGSVNGISEETLLSLLQLAPAFIAVREAQDSLNDTTQEQIDNANDLARIQAEKLALENKILELTGNTTELRRRELETISEVNRPLQEYIYLLEDQRDWLNNQADALGEAFNTLQRAVEQERKEITEKFNAELASLNSSIQTVSGTITKLQSFADSLNQTVNGLRPLTRDAARDQVLKAIESGDFHSQDTKFAIDRLADKSTAGYSSTFEYQRDQAKAAALLNNLGAAAETEITAQEQILAILNADKLALEQGFKDEIKRLDDVLIKAQEEIDAINGVDRSVKTVTEALGVLNFALLQNGGRSVVDPGTGLTPIGPGNKNISNQAIWDYFAQPRNDGEILMDMVKNGISRDQVVNSGRFTRGQVDKFYKDNIFDYFSKPRSADEIARDANKFGISSKDIIQSGRYTQADVDKFFKDNPNIPKFALGGLHRGGLRIVGERGPEIESTGPSRITANKDLKESIGNDEVIEHLKKLVKILDASFTGKALRTA